MAPVAFFLLSVDVPCLAYSSLSPFRMNIIVSLFLTCPFQKEPARLLCRNVRKYAVRGFITPMT